MNREALRLPGLRAWHSLDFQAVLGAFMLDAGLVLMLLSYLLVYGLGLRAGLFAVAGAPLLVVGILLDYSRARLFVFSVGFAIGCSWIYMAATW